LESIPLTVGGWTASEERRLPPSTETVLKATSYLSRTYQRNDQNIDFFMAFYALQQAGEAMHSPKNCLPGSGWEVWRHDTTEVSVNGEQVVLNQYGVQRETQRMVVLYWYQTPGRVVANEYHVKMYLVWDALLRNHTSGSIVRLVVDDEPTAVDAALEFAAQMIPLVQTRLPSSGD
jgi:EpsI family protein